MDFIIDLTIILLCGAISWAITTGVIWLIFLCFSLNFSIMIATGIWLVLLLLKGVFSGGKNG